MHLSLAGLGGVQAVLGALLAVSGIVSGSWLPTVTGLLFTVSGLLPVVNQTRLYRTAQRSPVRRRGGRT